MGIIEIITLASSLATTIGVFFAWYQIKGTKVLHKIQFEDSIAREYRDLIQKIPVKALLGEDLNQEEFEKYKPYLFHYINLTNDQIFLRYKNRISKETWEDWQGGIKANMNLPAFQKIWREIEGKSQSFDELRFLKEDNYDSDPRFWENDRKLKQLKS